MSRRNPETPAEKAERLKRRTQYLNDCAEHKLLSGQPVLHADDVARLAELDAAIDAYFAWVETLPRIGG